jgi:mRNA interferase RelE/StbE
MSGEREPRFEVRLHEKAQREYERLDGSIGRIVNKKLEELEYRADEIEKKLKGNLTGLREVKLKDAGIRIIYEITGETVDILGVVSILKNGPRADGEVFKTAGTRVDILKTMNRTALNEYLKGLKQWQKK